MAPKKTVGRKRAREADFEFTPTFDRGEVTSSLLYGAEFPATKRMRLSDEENMFDFLLTEDDVDSAQILEFVNQIENGDIIPQRDFTVSVLRDALSTAGDCAMPHISGRPAVLRVPASNGVPVCATCFKLCFYPSEDRTTLPRTASPSEFLEQLMTKGDAFSVENLFGLVNGKSTRTDMTTVLSDGKKALTNFTALIDRVAPTLKDVRGAAYTRLSNDLRAMKKNMI